MGEGLGERDVNSVPGAERRGEDDTPSRPVLIYDGDCGFCSWWVAALASRVASTARLQPSQTTDLRQLGLGEADVAAALQWVPLTGQPLSGARALAAWLGSGRWPWRLVGLVLSTPGISALAEVVYRRIAGVRHGIPGPWQRCPVPGQTPLPGGSSPTPPAERRLADRRRAHLSAPFVSRRPGTERAPEDERP